MIFVNLPVAALDKAKAFYAALGFVNEPKFTDATAAAMQWSEAIVVMLLTHAKWQGFTTRPIPDKGSSEVSLALGLESREAVDRMVEAGAANGGTADVNPPEDHGFMYQRTLLDLDGHIWEPVWMDPAMAESGPPEMAETHARAS
jgi:predicted lactoylglutathione lyase